MFVSVWERATQRLGISKVLGDKWLSTITTEYSDSSRYYHTTNHIEEMLTHYVHPVTGYCASHGVQEDLNIICAIYFHDIIYDGKSKTNEEDSVTVFQNFVRETNPDGFHPSKVEEYIIATKHHTQIPCDHPDESLKVFLDTDLAILAAGETRYNEYASQVRNEYSFVLTPLFEEKRAEFLKDFLEIPRLYKTDYYYSLWEEKARTNVRNEILA
eukprot:PhF_6_TR5772/c0_g1_i1/m.8517